MVSLQPVNLSPRMYLQLTRLGHLTSDIAQTSVGLPISEANPNHPNISIATSIPIATNVNASADPNTPAEIAQAGPQDRAKVKAVLKATGKALESLVVAGLAVSFDTSMWSHEKSHLPRRRSSMFWSRMKSRLDRSFPAHREPSTYRKMTAKS